MHHIFVRRSQTVTHELLVHRLLSNVLPLRRWFTAKCDKTPRILDISCLSTNLTLYSAMVVLVLICMGVITDDATVGREMTRGPPHALPATSPRPTLVSFHHHHQNHQYCSAGSDWRRRHHLPYPRQSTTMFGHICPLKQVPSRPCCIGRQCSIW